MSKRDVYRSDSRYCMTPAMLAPLDRVAATMATFRCSMLPYRLVDQCRACSRNVRFRYVNAAGGARQSECVRVVKTNGKRSLPAKRIYERGESEFSGDERKSLVPHGRLPFGECRQTRCHVAPGVCCK